MAPSPVVRAPGNCRISGASLQTSAGAAAPHQPDLYRGAHLLDDLVCHAPNADLRPRTQIESAAFHIICHGRTKESIYRIVHVGKIANGLQAAQTDAATCQGLGDDCGDYRAGRLARPICIKGPDGYNRQSIGAVETLGQFVRPYLACGIRGLALQRMGLIHWVPQGRPIDLAGGGMDQPLHPKISARHQDIQRPDQVRLGYFDGMKIRIGDGDQGAQVEYILAALHRLAHRIRVTQVSSRQAQPGKGLGSKPGGAARGLRVSCSGQMHGPRRPGQPVFPPAGFR